MSGGKSQKPKLGLWATIREGWGPYRRLYGYVAPYKWRFMLGLGFGFAFGLVNSLLPITVARVTSFIFHGATPNPMALRQHPEMLSVGPKINSIAMICLAIPAIMMVRSLFDYFNTYYMQWVSNKVVTDIRGELFQK